MITIPRQLNSADNKIALVNFILLVETQVAIALGASVQPLTNITRKVNRLKIIKEGLFKRMLITPPIYI